MLKSGRRLSGLMASVSHSLQARIPLSASVSATASLSGKRFSTDEATGGTCKVTETRKQWIQEMADLNDDINTDDIKQFYNKFSESYEDAIGGSGWAPPKIAANLVLQYYPKLGNVDVADLHVLDVGCGTGMTGEILNADHGFNYLYGCDISPGMLKVAASKDVYNELIETNLEHLDTELGSNPEYEGKFDIVICTGVLTYINNRKSVFDGFNKLLKKGGLIVLSHKQELMVEDIELINRFEDNHAWNRIYLSEPMEYIPDDKSGNYGDKVKAFYYVAQLEA